MKHFNKYIQAAGFALVCSTLALPANAQSILPAGSEPMIVVPHNQTISYRERTLCYDVTANVPFEVSADKDWVTVTKTADGTVYVYVKRNYDLAERSTVITFTNAEKKITEKLNLTQAKDESASDLPAGEEYNGHGVFTDGLYTDLKEDVTESQIENLTNEFIKGIARKMFAGEYSKDYRVAEYGCKLSPQQLSIDLNAPGKYYDQLAGVTGINVSPGKQLVAVSGIPSGKTVNLALAQWDNGGPWWNNGIEDTGKNGAGPDVKYYSLKNGMNIINYDGKRAALAYICYYADKDSENQPKLKVHFLNGQQNGYLSKDKTNEEMYAIASNACNTMVDVLGDRVHAVWTAYGLKNYCKASDGTSYGYRQYINFLDQLINWEHEVLGLKKYNRIPNNTTLAYVNNTYYMFQGGLGVSYKYDTERGVLNCKTLMKDNSDLVWGPSHEWGHQHQMNPYFCWGGLAEVSNNMCSYYNVMHMGYNYDRETFDNARNIFLNDDKKNVPIEFECYLKIGNTNNDDVQKKRTRRSHAYADRDRYKYSKELYDLCDAMKKYEQFTTASGTNDKGEPYEAMGTFASSNIPSVAENKLEAVSLSEVGVGQILAPFILLYNYFTHLGPTDQLKPDLYPDLYEALRQNDGVNGSQIEKQGEVDKYELIASAQNGNKNGKLAVLKEKYPESCWVKDNYIQEGQGWDDNSVPFVLNFIRKASRLSGYNLVPYFEKWGFLRTVAMRIGDYGNKYMLLTKNMYDEFVADMKALEGTGEGKLKAMDDNMVTAISNTKHLNEPGGDRLFQTPEIPN